MMSLLFCFKQKTAYEMRISDWSSDVCSSDLGSRALAGIGCHYMAIWMDRKTATFSHMGGEGAAWIGQKSFTTEKHVFANLGDGTYFHSGILAIRAAIAANANITYKEIGSASCRERVCKYV